MLAVDLHHNENLKMLSPDKVTEIMNRTKRVTGIQFEERSYPIGWGGKLGELVGIKLQIYS